MNIPKYVLLTLLLFLSPQAQATDEDIYELSADVLELLVKKYNGDPNKMNEVLLKAQKDPEGFAKTELTPSELAKIKSLSQRLPAQKSANP